VPALVSALKDASPLVRGRAAQALGLVGVPTAAPAIADAASGCAARIVGIAPDDEEPKTGEVEVCRLAIVALVRLRQFDATARVVLDAQGDAVSQWWPVAFALQRSGDARAAAPLVRLASVNGVYTQAFALRGLAALKDPRVVPLALAAASQTSNDVRLRAEAVRSLGRAGCGMPRPDC
jgi:HEAT repeat protein